MRLKTAHSESADLQLDKESPEHAETQYMWYEANFVKD